MSALRAVSIPSKRASTSDVTVTSHTLNNFALSKPVSIIADHAIILLFSYRRLLQARIMRVISQLSTFCPPLG